MHKIFSPRLAFAVLALAAPLTACYADKPRASAPKTPEVLYQAVKAGLTIEKSFAAVPGLQGWVIKDHGQYSVVYTTPDGKYLLSGLLINSAGKNLTQEFAESQIPKPDYSKFWSRIESSTWVATGATGNAVKSTIYAIMDPSCVFCSLAAKALLPYEAAGLQVRWIPVGVLHADSMGKAAAILESANPGETLAAHEKAYGNDKADTLKPITPKPETVAKLKANAELMMAMGFTGTPTILYKDAKGNVMARTGMPRLSDLAAITGLPEQRQTDPDLARF